MSYQELLNKFISTIKSQPNSKTIYSEIDICLDMIEVVKLFECTHWRFLHLVEKEYLLKSLVDGKFRWDSESTMWVDEYHDVCEKFKPFVSTWALMLFKINEHLLKQNWWMHHGECDRYYHECILEETKKVKDRKLREKVDKINDKLDVFEVIWHGD